MTTKNEAAERLREAFIDLRFAYDARTRAKAPIEPMIVEAWRVLEDAVSTQQLALDNAREICAKRVVAERALERAATVERYGSVLRRMYEHAKWYFPHNDETEDVLGEALAILDEVANAQEELRTADAKAAR